MNRIKKIIDKYKQNENLPKRKIENLLFFLGILIILVIVINVIFTNKDNNNIIENTSLNTKLNTKIEGEKILNETIEKKLETILSKVNGVSNVSVMVTYETNKEISPIYNLKEQETVTNETDTNGGSRNITEKEYNKEIVFEKEGNNSTITIEKEIEPKIAGVIVVANFNNNISLKQEIIKAVSVVTNISEYKIQVLNSK